LGVLEGGDEEAADEAEDENVALHDGVVGEGDYNGDGGQWVSQTGGQGFRLAPSI
jgi:hypothetical protein